MKDKLNIKTLTHALAWLILFSVMTTVQSIQGDVFVSIKRNAFIISVQIFVFYSNLFVLMPKLLERKNYFVYGLSIIGTIAVSMFILHMGEGWIIGEDTIVRKMQHIVEREPMPHMRKHIMRNGHKIMQGVSMFSVLFMSTLVRSVELKRKREQEHAELQTNLIEAESKFLKSQINPHFLFNALNNIYSLAQMESKKTPDSILQLSQMLRYVLYDADVERVKLADEVNYIANYVKLQLLKDDSIDTVKVNMEKIDGTLTIAPMLIIPFVENAFKHSNFESEGWIDLSMVTENSELVLTVKNAKPKNKGQKDAVGGVGLQNVKNRLELGYQGRHELIISDEEDQYIVKLNIDLNEA